MCERHGTGSGGASLLLICRKKCVRHQNLCSGARVEAGEIPGGRRKGPDQKQGEKDVACSETMRLFAYNPSSYCAATNFRNR